MTSIKCFAKKVFTAGPKSSIAFVAPIMEEHNVGAVVIAEQRIPVGIITDRDIALALGVRGASPQAAAASIMTSPFTIDQDAGVFYYTTRTLMEAGVRRLPIVDDSGELIGIVTLDDLVRVLARELTALVEGIRSEMEVK